MNHIQTTLSIGLEKSFSILHISDTHLTLADGREDARKQELAITRSKYFQDAEANLETTCRYAEKQGMTIVHTGDLIDFVSFSNLERATRFVREHDVFFIAGNHEFSLYVGEAFEDAAYREQSLETVQQYFPNNVRFHSRVMNGVNFVGIDNGYYLFDRWQLEALKTEVAKGYPIVLLMHNPLHEDALYYESAVVHQSGYGYLVASPEVLLRDYSEYRRRQQTADAITRETVAYIKKNQQIKAILTGHLHWDYEGMLTPTLPQYVTGRKTMREIKIE